MRKGGGGGGEEGCVTCGAMLTAGVVAGVTRRRQWNEGKAQERRETAAHAVGEIAAATRGWC